MGVGDNDVTIGWLAKIKLFCAFVNEVNDVGAARLLDNMARLNPGVQMGYNMRRYAKFCGAKDESRLERDSTAGYASIQ